MCPFITMDGKEYSWNEIAGMSGQLKMTMKITENKNYEGQFLMLCTGLCYAGYGPVQNIDAPDATIANVGKNKQLTYTILPGKGADLTHCSNCDRF